MKDITINNYIECFSQFGFNVKNNTKKRTCYISFENKELEIDLYLYNTGYIRIGKWFNLSYNYFSFSEGLKTRNKNNVIQVYSIYQLNSKKKEKSTLKQFQYLFNYIANNYELIH